MTIKDLIAERLEKSGQSKSAAAKELGITRVTLDNWLFGVHVPEPDAERVERIAKWARASEALVLAMILTARGIDASVFDELAAIAGDGSEFAKNRVREIAKTILDQPALLGRTTHRAYQSAA